MTATTSAPPRLTVDHVGIDYRNASTGKPFTAVADISFDVHQDKIVALVGPSGCGKSTLLSAIAGLTTYTSGEVLVDGKLTRKPGRERAMVFQKASLLPWRTALDNVAYPLRLAGVGQREARQRAIEALTTVGLKDFSAYFPDQLSGGMQQRVNIARALVVDPEILLLDEPFAAIDAQMREVLQGEVLTLLEHGSLSGIFVTHQIDEAVLVADTVVVMSKGPASTVKAVVDIPLPRPRPEHVRRSPEFAALVEDIWNLLRDDVLAASEAIGERR